MTPAGVLDGPETVKALTELGAALSKPQVVPGTGNVPFVVLPEGYTVEKLDRPSLTARPGIPAVFDDAASFSRYFQDHASGASRVYASESSGSFVAVLDEYGRGFLDEAEDETEARGLFNYREWRAVYQPALSPQWIAWIGSNGKTMTQKELAEFLEDHLPDIVEPDGSALMELVLNLELSQTGKFASTQRLQDGSAKLEYRNELQQVGQVQLPARIILEIPIYRHQGAVQVQAHLRFRLHGGGLTLHYQMIRPERAIEQAFEDLIGLVAAGCTLEGQASPILRGHV